jgi:glycine cleavage system transcriptional repressor
MHAAVSAVGVDRPGIVAAVTEVLHTARCNIEDSRMATLGGHFAMMLIVAMPDELDARALEERLQPVARDLDLVVIARAVAEVQGEHLEGEPYVVSVYGADHPGIVARVTDLLAARGVNIADLATHVLGADPAVYVMVMEVTLPPEEDASGLERDLKALASELAVDVSIHPMEPETL